ncbi:hypothetical protein M9Y10_039040 [Tritrichomonas musculus]|uniref:C2 NT-type domain-containing protein n=1 Tax=Tritrichomonas musculus TaxID=1915356 RepID=A0ABR2KA30_9EUKA
MKVVHFRISQVTIPPLKKQLERSIFLEIHIGPTSIEIPLEGKNYLKSKSIISFGYETASDHFFDVKLVEEKNNSDSTTLASIEIPLRVCPSNKRINDHLEMEIEDENFSDYFAESKNEFSDSMENDYYSEDEKSIIIFFEMHRSENKAKRFEAPLGTMRRLSNDMLMSFESSCSFSISSKSIQKKRDLSSSIQDGDNQKIESEPKNSQRRKQQKKDNEEQEKEIDIELLPEDQEQQKPPEEIIVIEEEEEGEVLNNDSKKDKEDIKDKEEDSKENLKDQNLDQSKEISKEIPNGRKNILHTSESSDYDDTELSEGDEKKNDHVTDDSGKYNILKEDDEEIPLLDQDDEENAHAHSESIDVNNENVEKEGSDNDETKKEEDQIFLNLSSETTVCAVYAPKAKKSNNTELENESMQENEMAIDNEEKIEDLQDVNLQEEETLQEEQHSIEIEDKSLLPDQNDENIDKIEQSDPPFSVVQAFQQFNQSDDQIPQQAIYPPPQSYQPLEEVSTPVQQQPPRLKFYTLNVQNLEILDNFSFYPSEQEIGSFYTPPPLLPITIRSPRY